MLKFLFLFLLLSFGHVKASDKTSDEFALIKLNHNVTAKDSANQIAPENKLQTKTKFIYAELIYQRIYAESKFFINGRNVSESLKKSVAQVKYTDEALDLLGADGWELTAAYKKDINSGSEYFYYLKKRID